MDKKTINWIRKDLENFERTIDELDQSLDSTDNFEGYMAGDPIICKYRISFLFKSLLEKGADVRDFKKEEERINKKLMTFMQNRGRDYTDKLYAELKFLVDQYPTMICFFLELDPIDMEVENDLNSRDDIEYLLKELDDDYDLRDIRIKVRALDDVLRCQFESNINLIMKEWPYIERDYYPDSFWWRHPSKILREREKSQEELTRN